MLRKNLLSTFIILIVSLVIVLDLFLHSGRHITFDGHIHMTTMAQFFQALSDGEFPVSWSNNFANYGIPLPLFAHQLPNYVGALLIGLGFSVVSAYNLTLFLGVSVSGLLFYGFLKKHLSTTTALAASIFHLLFAYRIINIYIRGALPEILGAAIFPLILIGIDYLFEKTSKQRSIFLLILGTALLALSHPMMLVIYSFPTTTYFLFKLLNLKSKRDASVFLILGVLSAGIGILISSYYLVPLVLEMKYFYQSQNAIEFGAEKFLTLDNFINPNWYYYLTHPGPRGNFIKLGLIEFLVLAITAVASLIAFFGSKKRKIDQQQVWVGISVMLLLATLPLFKSVYEHLPGLQQLQYPWRFLNALQFTIPVAFAFTIEKISSKWKSVLLISFTGLLIIVRTPQLYGKNYVAYDEANYFFTQTNLHTQSLNPIWSGNSEEYPIKTQQAEIIAGEAELLVLTAKNASRSYHVEAVTDARIVDYTFYFPGWEVRVDGNAVEIEFQDPNYRGLITYQVPAGSHTVSVEYKNTKIRQFSRIASILGIIVGITLIANYQQWHALLQKLLKRV